MASLTASATSGSTPAWPLGCRYLDETTMDVAYLQELSGQLKCTSGHLGYIGVKDRRLSLQKQLSLDSEQSRGEFAQEIERVDPEVKIFFIDIPPNHESVILVPKDTWEWLVDLIQVHPVFLEQYQRKYTGTYASFVTVRDGQTPDALHILIKVPASGHFEASLYVRFELGPVQRLTALLIGTDIATLIEKLGQHSFKNLVEDAGFPVFIPILKHYSAFIDRYAYKYGHLIAVHETRSGRGSLGLNSDREETLNKDEFKRLHWLVGNLRICVYALEFQLQLTIFIEESYIALLSLKKSRIVKSEDMLPHERHIFDSLESHRISLHWITKGNAIGLHRGQAQLDIADTILSQYHVTQGINIAEQSRQIAEQTKKISEQSQDVANASTAIARETRKDSLSMKAIATLTLIYLPTTFAATICSTVFFRTGVDDQGVSVDKNVWVFALAAVGLTVSTCLVWLGWTRYERKSFTKRAQQAMAIAISTE